LAIIVTGAVGLGAPAIAQTFERFREKDRRKSARAEKTADELRGLLDALTGTMFEHTQLLVTLESWMRDSTIRPSGESPTGPGPDTRPTRRELYTLNGRLAIRRGRDDGLVKALGDYLKPTDEAIAEIERLWAHHEPFDCDDDALKDRASLYRQRYEDFVDAAKKFLDRVERGD